MHAVWTDEAYLRFAPAQFAHARASLDRAVEWCARTADQQRQAARAVARWALTEHGFARITLRTVTANTASQKVAGAAGFRFEGVMRNAAWSRAGRGDMAVYSLIPNDLGDAGNP